MTNFYPAPTGYYEANISPKPLPHSNESSTVIPLFIWLLSEALWNNWKLPDTSNTDQYFVFFHSKPAARDTKFFVCGDNHAATGTKNFVCCGIREAISTKNFIFRSIREAIGIKKFVFQSISAATGTKNFVCQVIRAATGTKFFIFRSIRAARSTKKTPKCQYTLPLKSTVSVEYRSQHSTEYFTVPLFEEFCHAHYLSSITTTDMNQQYTVKLIIH